MGGASFAGPDDTPQHSSAFNIFQREEMFFGFPKKGLTFVNDSSLILHVDATNPLSFRNNPGTATNIWYDLSSSGDNLRLNGNLVNVDYDGFFRVRNYYTDFINWVTNTPTRLNGLTRFTLECMVYVPPLIWNNLTRVSPSSQQTYLGNLHIMQWGTSYLYNSATNYVLSIRGYDNIYNSNSSGGATYTVSPDSTYRYIPNNPNHHLWFDLETGPTHNYLNSLINKRNAYYHFVVVANSTLPNRTSFASIYINGKLAAYSRYAQNFFSFMSNPPSTYAIVFGRFNYGNGTLDEFSQIGSGIRMLRFYNRDLTEQEIIQNYNYSKIPIITR